MKTLNEKGIAKIKSEIFDFEDWTNDVVQSLQDELFENIERFNRKELAIKDYASKDWHEKVICFDDSDFT